MKKKYQKPLSTVVALEPEPIMALSSPNESLGGDQLSNKQDQAWDEKQWAWDNDAEEE